MGLNRNWTPSGCSGSRTIGVLATLVLSAAGCSTDSAPDGPADQVLVNATVLTVDTTNPVAQAIAIRGNRIVAVGSDADVLEWAGPNTRQVDMEGRTVTPGLLDAHAHFNGSGADRLRVLDLSYPAVQSVADIVEAVRAQVETSEPGEWILGRGWDEGKLAELRYVLASDLDEVSPENPVWLTHTMGHYGTANSLALQMADVDASTEDPPGGTLDRASSQQLTGVLKESAQRLVRGLIPDYSDAEIEEGMAYLADAFNSECMTGLKDPGVGEAAWESYGRVREAGDLTLRVFALWSSPGTIEETAVLIDRIAGITRPYEARPNDELVAGGVKLYVDGSGGARTAWLYDDWNRDRTEIDAGNTGYPTRDPQILRDQIRMLHDAGIHVSVHSIGDQAIDWTVDSYAEALESTPTRGLRHGIIHANIPTDHAIGEMARLQAEFEAGYPEPSPSFTWWIGDTYAGNFGPERSTRLNPFRTFQETGVMWAAGSDYTVTPFPARYGIWASVARETVRAVYGETPFGTDESVDVQTALRAQTLWVAHQMFMDDLIGSIEVGKIADLAVWDRNLYEVPIEEVKEMRCVATLFNGQPVYAAEDSPF